MDFNFPVSMNRRLLRWSMAGLLLAGTTLAAGPALAQAAAPPPPTGGAQIQAVTYAPIPAGAAFELQANSDDELTQEAIDRVNGELPNRGYAATDGAPLVMVIETNLVRGEGADNPLGQQYRPVAGKDHQQVEGQVQTQLFSSNQNSLLNPQRPIGSADRVYRISLSVYDRQSGLYVWRGSAMRDDPNLDVSQATHEMVAALIANVGKSLAPEAKPAP